MIPNKLTRILRFLYNKPASVTLITSPQFGWKTGKTDFGLKLTEFTEELGIIKEFAGNIETKDSHITFIQDFPNFDYWCFANHHPKMMLYDEAIESSPRRSAMTSLNVGWVKRIPQLSKGHCHLLVIAQTSELIDSIFQFPTFYRGTWIKIELKTVVLKAPWLHHEIKFGNLPRTNINFDPYLGATFKMEGTNVVFGMLPLPLKVLTLYAEGNSFTTIQGKLGIDHVETVRRKLQQACRAVSLTLSQQPSDGNRVIESCEKIQT
jgi:hypothetical protein